MQVPSERPGWSGWQRFMNLGVAGQSAAEVRRIRVISLATAGGLVFNTSYSVLYAIVSFSAFRWIILLNVLMDVVFLWVLRLNFLRRTDVAAWTLAVAGWLNIFTNAAVLGLPSGIFLFLFFFPSLAPLIRPKDDRTLVPTLAVLGVLGLLIAGLVFTDSPAAIADTTLESVLFAVSVVGVAGEIAIISVYNRELVDRTESALEESNVRSERLLLNILPAPIADRLKADEYPIADRSESVTVLSADLIDSTPLAERLSPDRLVKLLDRLFSTFDEIVDDYGLEKIATIGDEYMAVAGLPLPHPDPVGAAAEAALAMRAALADFTVDGDGPLQMRFGLHTGPVVAGVIGRRKFRYDLWGDTVNTASRMQSHGTPGKIHVTATVREELADRYDFETRGDVEIKGKGFMTTFLLEPLAT